ncbi:hypothetical protein DFH06DRAFT_1441602 [Mycena polygramma]|nr:hypothetical protein DFH06DRAFT_1441602 [Mycena polygramma]
MSSRPPAYPAYPSNASFNSATSLSINTKATLVDDERKNIPRTPSPTQSEYNYLDDIKGQKSLKQKIQYYAIIAVLLAAVILFSVFHTQIIIALKPFTDWLHNTPAGPLIPIAILIVLSFPPLFGHEIIAMLVGVAFGFPEACAIVAVGYISVLHLRLLALLTKLTCHSTFKYACSVRGKKMENKDISYGLLAHIIRNGGFLIVLVIRYSAIPPHFATSIFSTVGISFPIFLGAALLSLPKAFVPVYVGYALKPEKAGNTQSERIEKIVLVTGVLITIVAFGWIKRQMKAAREEYIYLRRKARQAKVDGPRFIGEPSIVKATTLSATHLGLFYIVLSL